MPICQTCHVIYVGSQCPNCQNANQSTVMPPNQHQNSCNTGGCNGGCQQSIQQPNPMQPPMPIPIEEPYNIQPKSYVVCPSCHTKNSRINNRCDRCGQELPIYNSLIEKKYTDQQIAQQLGKTREYYKRIGIRLFLAHHLHMDMPVICNNILPNGSRCQQRLTPLDNDCPTCRAPHIRYQCIQCQSPLSLKDAVCPRCHSPTYLSDTMSVLNGTAQGEGAEMIVTELEQTFQQPLRKVTFNCVAPQRDVIDAKYRVTRIGREIKTMMKTLSAYLRDFNDPSRGAEMGSAMGVMHGFQNGVFSPHGVTSPQMTSNLTEALEQRESQLVANNQPSPFTAPIPPPVANPIIPQIPQPPIAPVPHPVQQPDENANDPWNDTNI